MEETNQLQISIGEEKIKVSRRIASQCLYLHNILSLGFQDEEIEVDLISYNTFINVIRYCELNNFEDPIIARPIKTNNLQDVLDAKNYQFIKQFPPKSQEFIELVKASEFLICKGLQRLCASVYACMIYFADSKEAFEAKNKELNINVVAQFDEEEKLKRRYLFMQQS